MAEGIPMTELVDMNSRTDLPTRMQYRFREFNRIEKNTVKLVPNNGQGDLKAGDTVIVRLPFNAVLDLTTFIMEFDGETTDNGKIAANGFANHRQKRFFPRNTASIIEQLDVKINGQTCFTLNNYGLLYNILFDLTAAQDSLNRRKVGENADPSSKYYYDAAGVLKELRGYSIGSVAPDDPSGADKDHYVIRSWLGLLTPSTSIIDTNLLGSVVIKIRFAPPTRLILGASCNQAIVAVDRDDIANEIGVTIPDLAGDGQIVNPTHANYTLKNIKFTIVRYKMPAEFYTSEAAKLVSGSVF